ncbi:hypothetical protein G6F35_017201 [Rhizopus arrhizus]|nr:hypothetical protein G6F35_017201 [Rhizopus arrhizus]
MRWPIGPGPCLRRAWGGRVLRRRISVLAVAHWPGVRPVVGGLAILLVAVFKKRIGGQRMLHRGREFKRRHLQQLDGLLKPGRQRHLLSQAQFLRRVAQSRLLAGSRRKAAHP